MTSTVLARALWCVRLLGATALVASLAGCEVGPDYKRPAAEAPPESRAGFSMGEAVTCMGTCIGGLPADAVAHRGIGEGTSSAAGLTGL